VGLVVVVFLVVDCFGGDMIFFCVRAALSRHECPCALLLFFSLY